MKNMTTMKKFGYILVLAAAFATVSCEYLDETPGEYLTPEKIFADERWAEQALRMAYTYLPTGYNRYGGAFIDASTDDGAYAVDNGSINLISRGLLSLANPGESCWSDSYKGIRSALFFEENIHNLLWIPSYTDAQVVQRKAEWVGETKALRALYYFELVKRYGGVPIVTQTLTEEQARQVVRSGFAECVDHIATLCEQAAAVLPETAAFGRMSKGAALAIKGKALAYAASDLYDNVTNPLLGYTSGSILDRQRRAAEALAEVINYTVSGAKAYALKADFATICTDVTTANKEVILADPQTTNSSVEKNLYPPTLLGNGSTFPSQNFVDAFEYKTAADPLNPYLNRDPRFGMTVLYDESALGVRGTIYTRVGAGATQDALNAVKEKSTITGYYLRKFLAPSINFAATNSGNTTRLFPLIRLADILLLYAEMANEAYGPDGDPDAAGITARGAVNQVRARTGVAMPAIAAGVTAPQLRERIRNERRVELAFEDQRYFDVRRWKTAMTALNEHLRGMQVEKISGTMTYTIFTVDNQRRFHPYMYYSPIPYSEIKANPNLVQNPDWN